MFENNYAGLLEEEQIIALTAYNDDLLVYLEQKSPVFKDALLKKIVDKYRSILGFSQQDVVKHGSLLELAKETDETEVLTLKQLLELQNDTPTWLVPDLIADGGGLYIVAGAPKAGKTLIFVYQLAYSIAVLGNFLGNPCQRGKVLIFECEESTSKVARTFRGKGLSSFNPAVMKAVEEDRIRIVNNFDLEPDLTKLKNLVREYQPSLIIFDSLRASTKKLEVSENSSDMSKHLYTLQKALNYLKVPGVMIHHMSKNGKERGIEGVAGSLSLAGASDGVIMLYRNESTTSHSVELLTVPREGIPVNWIIERQKPKSGYWEYKVITDKGISPEQLRVERKILRFLVNFPCKTFSRKDLATKLGFEPDNQLFYQALDKLVDSLQIAEEQIEDGNFGVWISNSSPWSALAENVVNDDFTQADRLVSATSKTEVESIVTGWAPEYKFRIWSLLSPEEQTRILSLTNPAKFSEGTWVKERSTSELHQIKSKKFNTSEKLWIYEIEGGRQIEESFLELSLDYSENF